MKAQREPSYWLLDVFVCGMIALGIILMQPHIARQWERLIDIGWAALAIAGMSIWVWANWPALRDEDRRQHSGLKRERAEPHWVEAHPRSLTPGQRHFVDAMRRSSRR